MATAAYFTAELFEFLEELRRNNNRDWFNANKQRYEASVRGPCLALIADVAPRLKRISPHFVADPSPVGGSMMRIYRDIRFSKDKTPYRTALGLHFGHATGEEGAPAFYVHLEPDASSVGGGAWRPPPPALKRIRDAIASKPGQWERVSAGEFRAACGMHGTALKRPPPGYDPDHRFIEDIKRRDFAASLPLTRKQICSPAAMDIMLDAFEAIGPFMRFLTEALGLPYQSAAPRPASAERARR